MSIDYNEINLYIRTSIAPILRSSFITTKPLLAIMAEGSNVNADKLGTPDMRVVFGGVNVGRSKMAMLDGTYNNAWKFQKHLLDPTETFNEFSTPVATQFAEDAITTAETHNVLKATPMRIRQSRLNKSGKESNKAVGSLLDDAISELRQNPFNELQSSLWNGTLTASQQDADEWANHIGLNQIVSDGSSAGETAYTSYGAKVRSSYAHLKGTVLAAADLVTGGYLVNLKPTLALLRKMRNTKSLGGVANYYPNAGSLVITTSDLWNVLADQVEDKKTIFDSGADLARYGANLGWQYPVIKYGSMLITFDPTCLAGQLNMLTPESFMFEVSSDNNFAIQPWKLESEQTEGGGYYRWTLIQSETRFSCFDPYLQVKVKGLTVSGV